MRSCDPQFPPEGAGDLPMVPPPPSCVRPLLRAGGGGNPPLQAQCGLKVMLVVDRSGSIATAGATGAVKSALTAFINTLNNTGSTVALVDFSDPASLRIGYTTLSNSTAGTFDSYISGFSPDGYTNWDDALNDANTGSPTLTLFITDGQPNRSGGHGGHTNNASEVLNYAVSHANSIKGGGSRMFVVGVGAAASFTTELAAVSGPSNGTNIATNDYSTVASFNDLAASLENLVYGLCASSMTVSKYVDGVLATGWDVTATVTAVNPGPGFEWRNTALAATAPSSRTRTTGAGGTATFEWLIGSAANPVPGSVTMTLNENVKAGYRFTGGNCTIDSQAGTDRTVTITTLPHNLGSIPWNAIVKCNLNNQTIPVATPVAPTVTQAQCTNGVLSPPTLTLPSNAGGITRAQRQPAVRPGGDGGRDGDAGRRISLACHDAERLDQDVGHDGDL